MMMIIPSIFEDELIPKKTKNKEPENLETQKNNQ
jgi:hypothetical protein